MHTIKPLDETALLQAARDTQVLITVEEHSVYGGLGEACAAVLLRNTIHVPFEIVGIPDEYTVTGVIENVPPNSHLQFDMLCSFKTLYVLQNSSLMRQIAESSATHAAGTGHTPTKEQLDEIVGI